MDELKPLDVLAIVAHPDDAELCMGGTLLKMAAQGHRTGVVDLTRGELGTRGSADLRDREAADAAQVLGLSYRANLNLGDGFFEENETSLRAIITQIRHTRPRLVLTNAPTDRHPDHGRAEQLVQRACFLSGLPKIETYWEVEPQKAHRPAQVFAGVQDHHLQPSFVVDISAWYEQKLAAICCYASQFYDPHQPATGPQTPISTEEFWLSLQARAKEYGRILQVQYAEGFISRQPLWADTPLSFVR